jgi:hypothetical protein
MSPAVGRRFPWTHFNVDKLESLLDIAARNSDEKRPTQAVWPIPQHAGSEARSNHFEKSEIMSGIMKPKKEIGKANNVAKALEFVTKWHDDNKIAGADAQRKVWYRGHSKRVYAIAPGVYRNEFTNRAQRIYGKDIEEKRLNLEREIINQFRTSGAALLNRDNLEEMYFVAQHYGIPTRLLDWTTNPLAALFFAACSSDGEDGEVFVMDATTVNHSSPSPDIPKGIIITMRHPYAVDAIRVSFWIKPAKPRSPMILPIRPDNLPGRIGQQSSCFTMHMSDSKDCTGATIGCIVIDGKSKANIMSELGRLNINRFTVFGTLDHLAEEIRANWEVGRR